MTTWLRGFLRRQRHEADLDRELRLHLDQRIDDLLASGHTRDEAERIARRELGSVAQITAEARDQRPGARLDQLIYDLRDAWRALRRSPGITLTAVTLIAIVIGGNTTIFSMVHSLLTKQAPGINAERLVTLTSFIDGRLFGPEDSYPDYLDYAAQSKTLQSLIAYQWERSVISTAEASYAVAGVLATPNYFDVLGLRLARGRAFSREESQRDASGLVAVISHRFWQNQLNGDENILGRVVTLNGHPATIIGVAPPKFHGVTLAESADIWVPLITYTRIHDTEKLLYDRRGAPLIMVGQLAPGVSLREAQTEFGVISKRMQTAYPATNRNRWVTVFPYFIIGTGSGAYQMAPVFMAIFGVVALLTIAIVCANVANLMLARAMVRQRELAVRQSLGASRIRIVRVLCAEGLIVSMIACLGACLTAFAVARGIVGLLPPNNQGLTITPDFTPDWVVIAYAMGLALIATIACSIAPAMRAYRQAVLPWLKAGEQGVVQGGSRLSSALVVLQLTFAVLLLTSAGLAWRSQTLIGSRDLGFDPDHLLLVTVSTTAVGTNAATNLALLDRVRERLLTVPGVTSVAYARSVPPFGARDPVRRAGQEEPVLSDGAVVGPEYLRTLGLQMLAGREFSARDAAQGHPVVVINQNLAEALFPGRSPLGETMLLGRERRPFEIIGVMPNAYLSGVRDDAVANFYLRSQHQQTNAPPNAHFYIRYTGSLDAVAPVITRTLHDVDAHVPIAYMRTMQTQLDGLSMPTRIVSTLLMMFALGSLAIAAIGQYAVMAFNMRRRTRDFGVRIALGASSPQILRAVIAEGIKLTAIGLALGFALSLINGAAFRSVVTGVTPTDGPTYLGVLILLSVASLLACYLPAYRASRINPIEALRQE
jgi:predicted permease